MNKHIQKLKKVFASNKQNSMLAGILALVLYINVFHCNDYSKYLVSTILLWYFFNQIFDDFYISLAFSVAAVAILDILQRGSKEHFAPEEGVKMTMPGDVQPQDPPGELEDTKEEDMSETNGELPGASNDLEDIGEIPDAIVTKATTPSTTNNEKFESNGGQQQLAEFTKSIDQIHNMINKLTPTVTRGMQVMEKIEKLGFLKD